MTCPDIETTTQAELSKAYRQVIEIAAERDRLKSDNEFLHRQIDLNQGIAAERDTLRAEVGRLREANGELVETLRNVLWLFRGDGGDDEKKAQAVLAKHKGG